MNPMSLPPLSSTAGGSLQVLLIEDDAVLRRVCVQALDLADLPGVAVGSAEEGLARLAAPLPDGLAWGVVVSDVCLPGLDGRVLLQRLPRQGLSLPVILVTGHGDIAMAVEAMRDGAYDFIEKPFGGDRLVESVRRALDRQRLSLENQDLRARLERLAAGGQGSGRLLGDAPAMRTLRRHIEALAPLDVEVLIQGETGSGKEEVARALHEASGRRGEFVALNCAALPESVFESEVFGHESGAFTGAGRRRIGRIEHAQGGTLFLDEIESMPLSLQVKLLRVLQQGTLERLGSNQIIAVDCRLLAATKVDLLALSETGAFRADLYYRLHVAPLQVPPLRQRREDVPLLLAHFLAEAAARYRRQAPVLSPAQLARWLAHDWPGNVRELKNVAHRLCLGLDEPGETLSEPGGLVHTLDQVERLLIEEALAVCEGQVSRAAERLQLPRKTLYDKLARLGLGPHRAGER